jgi:predicted Rossmann fold nucleotide-binding protein DprA/Smf involved in DNA uptake
MQAAQWTFPARNRLMAAMSDAVLVIEATEKSGTLITARQALELGRDIGAVPGDIFSDSSCGTNMLIKEGAYMIRNAMISMIFSYCTRKCGSGTNGVQRRKKPCFCTSC